VSTVIRIPENTYSRLQALAQPFVDTPASVIGRLLDYYEQGHGAGSGNSASSGAKPGASARRFVPEDPPELSHTRFIAGEVNGLPVRNWNRLLDEAHRAAIARGVSDKDVVATSLTHAVVGKETDRGFRYLSDINISVQGVDSGSAWKHAFHLAKKYQFALSARFAWRDKPGAAYPGQEGELVWTP
jgi:hypothetical protein